jgi:hypothetical protein
MMRTRSVICPGVINDPDNLTMVYRADLLLAGIFLLVAMQHRRIGLLQGQTSQLAFQVSELNALVRTTPPSFPDRDTVTQRAPSMRYDETTLIT